VLRRVLHIGPGESAGKRPHDEVYGCRRTRPRALMIAQTKDRGVRRNLSPSLWAVVAERKPRPPRIPAPPSTGSPHTNCSIKTINRIITSTAMTRLTVLFIPTSPLVVLDRTQHSAKARAPYDLALLVGLVSRGEHLFYAFVDKARGTTGGKDPALQPSRSPSP
jgi:hypothetical protein